MENAIPLILALVGGFFGGLAAAHSQYFRIWQIKRELKQLNKGKITKSLLLKEIARLKGMERG